ncbi:MAG TPA: recombinase RecT, partial [Xanthobacteraceae bacterium]
MNQIEQVPQHSTLVPASMQDAMELARMMANSTLVPKEFQKQPANCLLVIMQAVRWEMDPFAVIQETSIIQGKPMYQGKLVAAVVNARGNLRKPLDYRYGDDKDGRYVLVLGQRRHDDEEKEVRVNLKDAKTQNTQWQKQPDQQLAYHGARVWARRWTPELMLGVYSPEEFAPERERVQVSGAKIDFDRQTGEIAAADVDETPIAYGSDVASQ